MVHLKAHELQRKHTAFIAHVTMDDMRLNAEHSAPFGAFLCLHGCSGESEQKGQVGLTVKMLDEIHLFKIFRARRDCSVPEQISVWDIKISVLVDQSRDDMA